MKFDNNEYDNKVIEDCNQKSWSQDFDDDEVPPMLPALARRDAIVIGSHNLTHRDYGVLDLGMDASWVDEDWYYGEFIFCMDTVEVFSMGLMGC